MHNATTVAGTCAHFQGVVISSLHEWSQHVWAEHKYSSTQAGSQGEHTLGFATAQSMPGGFWYIKDTD